MRPFRGWTWTEYALCNLQALVVGFGAGYVILAPLVGAK